MKTQGQQSDVLFLSGSRTGFGSFRRHAQGLHRHHLRRVCRPARPGQGRRRAGGGGPRRLRQRAPDQRRRHLPRPPRRRSAPASPSRRPAVTVNRLCGSGFEAIIQGAQQILLGESKIVLAGGAESMSQAPHVVRGARWGLRLGPAPPFEDLLWESLKDPQCGFSMAETAENLADKYKISRAEVDAYALTSQQRAKAGWDGGFFADELAPVPIKNRKTKQDEPWARRRAHAPRHHRRGAGQAGALLQEGRRGDGRERLRHLRRRRRGGPGRRGRAAKGLKPIGRLVSLGRRRGGAQVHGHRPGAGGPEGAGQGRASRSTRWTWSR